MYMYLHVSDHSKDFWKFDETMALATVTQVYLHGIAVPYFRVLE